VASLIQGAGISHQHAMQRQMQQHHMAQAVAQAQAQAASMGHHGYPMPLHPNHHQQTINSILSGQNAANAMQLPYANNFNGPPPADHKQHSERTECRQCHAAALR